MIIENTQPYEILYRFNAADGTFQGAHFRTITTYTDDKTGQIMFSKEGDPMNIAAALAAGYSITDIATTATTIVAQAVGALQAAATAAVTLGP
jgi:hypothetical protein